MSEVPLTRGMVTLVDEADLPLIAGYAWRPQPRSDGKGWYARAYVPGGGRKKVLMHRLLMPGLRQVDHKNGNGLDNRRSTGNLRPATDSQNRANSTRHLVRSSRFKGVRWHKKAKRWETSITLHRRRIHLGCFTSEEDAARAYNVSALRLFGEYARLNEVVPLAKNVIPSLARLL